MSSSSFMITSRSSEQMATDRDGIFSLSRNMYPLVPGCPPLTQPPINRSQTALPNRAMPGVPETKSLSYLLYPVSTFNLLGYRCIVFKMLSTCSNAQQFVSQETGSIWRGKLLTITNRPLRIFERDTWSAMVVIATSYYSTLLFSDDRHMIVTDDFDED